MAGFSCGVTVAGDTCIVRPVGYLDDATGREMRAAFQEPLQRGVRRFVLNLQGTPVINSQGITQVLELVEELVYDQQGSLALVGVSELYLEVFRTVGILHLVKTFPDEASALQR